MKTILKLLVIVFVLTGLNRVYAQEKKLVSGNSFTVGLPIGNMASTYDFGWGIYANIDYNLNSVLAARFDLGYNSFSGPDSANPVTGLPEEVQQDVWEFTAGLRAKIAIVYVEARGGYFTGVSAWGVVPAIGLRLGKLDIQGNLNIAGENHWYGARIGYYWGK